MTATKLATTATDADTTSDAGDGATAAVPAQSADRPAAGRGQRVTSVLFGIDALGRWKVELRDPAGAPGADAAAAGLLELSGYPTDDPAAAVELREALRARYPDADVVWRPGVMDTFDETKAAAHRALAASGEDRQNAQAAAEHAARTLRAAVKLAHDAGVGPVEVADRTGYARSTVTKLLRAFGDGRTV
jgi:hypothetical protein